MKKKIVIVVICLCILAVVFIPAILNISSSLRIKNGVTDGSEIKDIKKISKAIKKEDEKIIKDEKARQKIENELMKREKDNFEEVDSYEDVDNVDNSNDNDNNDDDQSNVKEEKITGKDITVVSLDPLEEIEWLMNNIYLEDLYLGSSSGFDKDITEIQWENIRVDSVIGVIKGILSSIDKLLLDIPQSKVLTAKESSKLRSLLIKYSSSVSFLIRQGERNVSAKEALAMVVGSYNNLMQYFNNLVTSAKIKGEEIDISVDDVKFDKFFASPSIKNATNADSNFLTSTTIFLKMVNIKEDENLRSTIAFNVEIEGTDMSRLEIYNQFGLYENISVNYIGEKKQKRLFSFDKAYPAEGIYVIKVISSVGKYYYKRYLFYPRVKIFPFENGSYKLPFLNDEYEKLDNFFEIQSTGRINNNFIDREFVEGF